MWLAPAQKARLWAATAGCSAILLVLAFRAYSAIPHVPNGPDADDGRRFTGQKLLSPKAQGRAAVVLAFVILVSAAMRVGTRVAPSWNAVRCALRGVVRCLRQAPQEPEAELVRREVSKLRMQFAGKLMDVMDCFFLPFGLLTSLLILAVTFAPLLPLISGEHFEDVQEFLTKDLGLGSLTVVSVVLTVRAVKPRLLTSEALDCLIVVVTFLGLWNTCALSAHRVEWNYGRSVVARTIMAIVCSNETVLAGALITGFAGDFAVRRKHGFFHVGPVTDAGLELAQAVVVMAFSWTIHRLAVSEARALVQARQTGSTNALVHRLLDSMCDAVVLLDADFDVSAPSPKLEGLLLHRALPTQCFTDLMHVDDHERFLRHVEREARLAEASQLDEVPPAFALHVRLRDANSSSVPVELFCSCLPDSSTGLLQYMVGVKEEGLRAEGLRAETEPADSLGHSAHGNLGPSPQSSLFPLIPENSSSTGSDDVSEVCSLPDDAREMRAWVDPFDPDLPVLLHTPGFTALSGPSAVGAELATWFERDHRFIARFQERANEWVECGRGGSLTLSGVTFSPSQLKPFGISLKGTITITMGGVEGAEDGGRACVSFSDVQAKQRGWGRSWAGTPRVGMANGRLCGQQRTCSDIEPRHLTCL